MKGTGIMNNGFSKELEVIIQHMHGQNECGERRRNKMESDNMKPDPG